MDGIWDRSQGIPRVINNVLYRVLGRVSECDRLPRIDGEFVRVAVEGIERVERPEFESLTKFQQLLVRRVARLEPFGIRVPDLADELREMGHPTTRSSVSTVCRRLGERGWLLRKREGKTHRLRISSFAKTILAEV